MTKSFAAVMTLVLAGSISPAVRARSAAPAGCYRCVAIYNQNTGRVLQTCPDGYASGGLQCIVQADECRTTGTCSP